jgi:hypothetical protein
VTDSATHTTPEASDEDLGDLLLEAWCFRLMAAPWGIQSANHLMGDEVLMKLARELAEKMRDNLSIDWEYKENVRTRQPTMIKTLPKRYRYPPDQDVGVIQLALRQNNVMPEKRSKGALAKNNQVANANAFAKRSALQLAHEYATLLEDKKGDVNNRLKGKRLDGIILIGYHKSKETKAQA